MAPDNVAMRTNLQLNEADSLALTYDATWNLLVDRNLAGKQIAAYIHGNRVDEVVMASRNSAHYYPLSDALGSVNAISGEQGGRIADSQFDAFGLPRSVSSGYRFIYTGREWLGPVGLNEHRNRYYNPSSGRWLTTDPIRFFSEDNNIYRYVYNNIIDQVDPLGLNAIALNASGAVGGAGHEGLLVGQPGSQNYTYYSFGSGNGISGSMTTSDNLYSLAIFANDTQSAIDIVNQDRLSQGLKPYDGSIEIISTVAQDILAKQAADLFGGNAYNILTQNCLDLVIKALEAIGIKTDRTTKPNTWHAKNNGLNNTTAPAPKCP